MQAKLDPQMLRALRKVADNAGVVRVADDLDPETVLPGVDRLIEGGLIVCRPADEFSDWDSYVLTHSGKEAIALTARLSLLNYLRSWLQPFTRAN
ncbi:hypothetical protein [Aureimonas mangrovi]|uniref:hypothetical protein n=1 Tax=Aureimonas mangrovi TaxID=2758041 RepID=UPI00163DB74B|nr:hypothetical protein [Aureimonas mangrovi]